MQEATVNPLWTLEIGTPEYTSKGQRGARTGERGEPVSRHVPARAPDSGENSRGGRKRALAPQPGVESGSRTPVFHLPASERQAVRLRN